MKKRKTTEFILYDSTYMRFENSQNYYMMIEKFLSILCSWGGDSRLTEKAVKEFTGVM